MTDSTELERYNPTQAEVIRPLAVADVVGAMQQHQSLLQQILERPDWQGEPNAKGSFVVKSGWRKIAAAYSLSFARIEEDVERDAQGMPLRASYTVAAIAPNGRRMEATGHCAYAESRFSGPRGNISKLENDLRATAETRAKNRAISDLVGMGKVSAEEVDAGHPEAGPSIGPEAIGKLLEKGREAIAYMLTSPDGEVMVDPDDEPVNELLDRLHAQFGYVPGAVILGIGLMTKYARELWGDTPPPEPEPEPEPEAVDAEPVTDAEVVDEAAPAQPEGGNTRVNDLADGVVATVEGGVDVDDPASVAQHIAGAVTDATTEPAAAELEPDLPVVDVDDTPPVEPTPAGMKTADELAAEF